MENISTAAGATTALNGIWATLGDGATRAAALAERGIAAVGLDGLPLTAVAIACVVGALIPLAARRVLLALVCLCFAGVALALVGGAVSNSAVAVLACAAGTLLAVWAVFSEKARLNDAKALLAENERALERARNELRAERFWRHASGDGRREIPSQELLELARKTEKGIRENDDAIAA